MSQHFGLVVGYDLGLDDGWWVPDGDGFPGSSVRLSEPVLTGASGIVRREG